METGPLAKSTVEFVFNITPALLWQIFGSTEMMWHPMLVHPRSHWQYMEFYPLIGPTLEQLPISDPYEVVIQPHPDPALSWARPAFDLFPGITEWRSRDLLRRCEDPGMRGSVDVCWARR